MLLIGPRPCYDGGKDDTEWVSFVAWQREECILLITVFCWGQNGKRILLFCPFLKLCSTLKNKQLRCARFLIASILIRDLCWGASDNKRVVGGFGDASSPL